MDEAAKVDKSHQYLQPGKAVDVQWSAQWHRGTVIQLGPQLNLLKLRDIASDATILLEARNVKLMEANTLDKQFYVGRRVGYHDNDEWKEALIVSNKAIGDVLVQWRTSAYEPYKQNWFQDSNVMLHNEDGEDDDVATNAIAEPIAHFPGSTSYNEGLQMPLPQIPQSQSHYGLYSSIPTSPTYESMHSMLSQQPVVPQMMFLHHRYRPWHVYNHFHRLRTGIDPTGMETMSLPGLRPNPYEIPQPSRTNLHLNVNNSVGDNHEEKRQSLCIQSSSPAEIRVEVDGSALLSVIVNVSESNFTWYKNEERLLGGKNITVLAPNILHLQHATQTDAGEYKCVISCELDTITYTCNVTVFESSLPSESESKEANEIAYVQLSLDPDHQSTVPIKIDENEPMKLDVTSRDQDNTASPRMEVGGDVVVTDAQGNTIMLSDYSIQTTEPALIDVSNPLPKIQRRISAVLKTDIQDYLQGYGENYGAALSTTNSTEEVKSYLLSAGDDSQSPTSPISTNLSGKVQPYVIPVGIDSILPTSPISTNLTENVQPYLLSVGEHSPLPIAPTSQPDELIANEDEIVTSPLQSSSSLQYQTAKNTNAPNNVQKSKKGFFHHKLFKKTKVKKSSCTDPSDASASGIQSDATTQNKLVSNVIPVHVEKAEQLLDNKMNSELMTEYQTDDDSVNVNTSLDGSSGSEKASLNEQLDASLPLEREPVAELVRKLQLAAEAHTPQYVIQQHRKKKTFVSNLFHSKTKQSE
ncbi:hypothetical protein EMCRGX_G018095 [Ephydatia muelleri]